MEDENTDESRGNHITNQLPLLPDRVSQSWRREKTISQAISEERKWRGREEEGRKKGRGRKRGEEEEEEEGEKKL